MGNQTSSIRLLAALATTVCVSSAAAAQASVDALLSASADGSAQIGPAKDRDTITLRVLRGEQDRQGRQGGEYVAGGAALWPDDGRDDATPACRGRFLAASPAALKRQMLATLTDLPPPRS